MTILDKYISKEFFRIFFMMIISFIAVFLIVDFFGRIRMFLSNGATLVQMGKYFFYSLPQIIAQVIPVAVLLSSLLTFGMLSRNLEITAMKANGVSLHRTAVPVFIIAVFISLFSFFFNEVVVPYSNQQAKHIKLVDVQKKKQGGSFKQNQIWYKSKNAIYNFGFYDYERNVIQGITINYFDQNFGLEKRIDAREARWTGNGWIFTNVMITSFPEGMPSINRVGSTSLDISETPADFTAVQKKADEMGYLELRDYIKKIRSEGYDASLYITDLHGKIAFIVVNLILVVLGISFSLRTERSGGIAASFGAGIILGFSYWIVFAFGLSLGRSGTLPPFLAAWTANILFTAASVLMIFKVRT
ncbi:MAG: LPS export ABC transporter permease LptG [Syntrophaceae bacterium]